jgi:hypothetical protein
MKQIEGNSPKCSSCYYYAEKEPNDGCLRDGWCSNPYECSHGVNGKKLDKPKERVPVRWNQGSGCYNWEDAEDRISHFDYVTGKYREKNIQKKFEV